MASISPGWDWSWARRCLGRGWSLVRGKLIGFGRRYRLYRLFAFYLGYSINRLNILLRYPSYGWVICWSCLRVEVVLYLRVLEMVKVGSFRWIRYNNIPISRVELLYILKDYWSRMWSNCRSNFRYDWWRGLFIVGLGLELIEIGSSMKSFKLY